VHSRRSNCIYDAWRSQRRRSVYYLTNNYTLSQHSISDYVAFITNITINGLIAQQQNGAAIIIEHRFFGYSNPYDNLTSQSLALLTIQQAIDDLVYFATTANLPMPGGDAVKPGQAPWILIGGSYSGALTSYTMVR
jgi:hypothetical protein